MRQICISFHSCLIFLLLCTKFVTPQAFNYQWPLDSPRTVTGSFGELRPNHFHAGIDFSTNGKINRPVFAASDGYISRIRISPVGYGKSIYITHNDGLVTLYAHLNSFNPKIDEFVREELYREKRYDIDLLVEPQKLVV